MSLDTAAEATSHSLSGLYKDQVKSETTIPSRPKCRYYPDSEIWCRFPDYSYLPAHPFIVLSQSLKFEGFAKDVQSINKKYVTRRETKVLWKKRVRRAFRSSKLPGMKEAERKLKLKDALGQTKGYSGFDPQQYWDLSGMMQGVGNMSVAREVEDKTAFQALRSKVADRRARKLATRRRAGAETSALGLEKMKI